MANKNMNKYYDAIRVKLINTSFLYPEFNW